MNDADVLEIAHEIKRTSQHIEDLEQEVAVAQVQLNDRQKHLSYYRQKRSYQLTRLAETITNEAPPDYLPIFSIDPDLEIASRPFASTVRTADAPFNDATATEMKIITGADTLDGFVHPDRVYAILTATWANGHHASFQLSRDPSTDRKEFPTPEDWREMAVGVRVAAPTGGSVSA